MGDFQTDMRLFYCTNKLVLGRKIDFADLGNTPRKRSMDCKLSLRLIFCLFVCFFMTENKGFVRHI